MKILQWLFGSFFRTIGRTIAILLMGGLLYYILSINGIGISDLFLDKVKAAQVDSSAIPYGYELFDSSDSFLSHEESSLTWTQYSNDNLQRKRVNFTNAIQSHAVDWVEFNVLFSQPMITTSTTSEEGRRCLTWTCNQYCASGACTGMCEKYQCTQYGTWTAGSETTVYDNGFTDMQVLPIVTYEQGGWASCSMYGNTITCPTNGKDIKFMDFDILFKTSTTTTLKVSMSRTATFYKSSTSQIIDNQNQNTQSIINQQQNSTQQILDSNTTEADNTGKDFITNFSNNTHGLTGIITAPLNAIQSLSSATCSPLILPLPFTDNKTLTLPCMSSIYSEYFGAFYTMYQGIILGLISYWVCVRIFGLAKSFKDPEDDKIEVVDL